MSATISAGAVAPERWTRELRFGHESEVQSAAGVTRSLQWVLKRNCSLAPRQLLMVYAVLCTVSLGIASACWWFGATLVAPFAWLELLALGTAMLVYARHATDSESIRLDAEGLRVERAFGRRVERVDFQPEWVRVEPRAGDRSLVELSGQGRSIAVGRHVRPELRRGLAEELRWALRRWHRQVAGGAQ